MTPTDLEPAVRDPKKLRNTAFLLVGIMIVGGWLILKAYEKWSVEKSKDNRPAIIHQIRPERSLRMVRQDGTKADLMDLRGKVYLLNVVHMDQLDESAKSLAVMSELASEMEASENFRLVTLVLNPVDATEAQEFLIKSSETLNATLPKWWLGTNQSDTLRKFIRKELKPSTPPEKIDGKWLFDPRIVLIDKQGHLRRAVVPQESGGRPYVGTFDFDQATKWDDEGKLTGTDLSNQEQLKELLKETINRLLDEPYTAQ